MMSCKQLFRLAQAAILLVVFASALHAQYRASIQGVVTDPEGAIIPGAKATLTNLETGKSQETTSNSEGIYNFGALPPSHFKIEVSKEGFKTKVLDNVSIIAEQVNSVNV